MKKSGLWLDYSVYKNNNSNSNSNVNIHNTQVCEGFIPSLYQRQTEYSNDKISPYRIISVDIPFFPDLNGTNKFSMKTPSLNEMKDILKQIPTINLPDGIKEVTDTQTNFINSSSGFSLSQNELENIAHMIFKQITIPMKKYVSNYKTALHCQNLESCKWELRDYRIYYIGEDDYRYYIDLQQIIFIEQKAWGYSIRTIASFDKDKNKDIKNNEKEWKNMVIHDVKLEGLVVSDKINLLDGYDPAEKAWVKFTDQSLSTYQTGQEKNNNPIALASPQGYYDNSNESVVLFDPETSHRLVQQQQDNFYTDTNGKGYQCYGKTAFSKFDCESAFTNQGKKQVIGTWDKPCKFDFECPFYQANKNYKNDFGGCIKFPSSDVGKCEMPIGVRAKGIRYYDTDDIKNTAKCHNCRPEDGAYCCERQKNKQIYPNLKSPDYAFENDYDQRQKYTNEFEMAGLQAFDIL